MSTNFL